MWKGVQSKRFSVLVCHRRLGKTWFALIWLVYQAIQDTTGSGRYAYIAPTYAQAKKVSWDLLLSFVGTLPGIAVNRSELSVTFDNGSRIFLLGAEQADNLRGIYLSALVMDETALVSSAAWATVLLPTLADRRGKAVFIGTPLGRLNLFYEQWEQGQTDPEYFTAMYKASETGIIPDDELRLMKRSMRLAEYDQELEVSWDGAVLGSYWGPLVKQLIDDNRYLPTDYDNTLPVYAALDLGYGDTMVWLMFQKVGTRIHIIDVVAFEQTSIPDQVPKIKALPHCPEQILVPHDAGNHDLTNGQTREEAFNKLGMVTIRVPKMAIHDQVSLASDTLPRVYIDDTRCKILVEALIAYRANFDPVKRVYTVKPVHDWSSHYASAFCYLCAGLDLVGEWGHIEYGSLYSGRNSRNSRNSSYDSARLR